MTKTENLTLYSRSAHRFIYRRSPYRAVNTFHLGYKNQSVYAVSGTSRCLFSDKYSVGRAYSFWMLNCWCITWTVGFKRLKGSNLLMEFILSVIADCILGSVRLFLIICIRTLLTETVNSTERHSTTQRSHMKNKNLGRHAVCDRISEYETKIY